MLSFPTDPGSWRHVSLIVYIYCIFTTFEIHEFILKFQFLYAQCFSIYIFFKCSVNLHREKSACSAWVINEEANGFKGERPQKNQKKMLHQNKIMNNLITVYHNLIHESLFQNFVLPFVILLDYR